MRRAGTLATICFGALLAGCSLLFGLDASDYVALATGAGVREAGSSDGPPATTDAAADGSFCASIVPPPTFCEDFDDADADLGARWPLSQAPSTATGVLKINPSVGVSPPSSLHTSLKASGNGSEQSYVGKSFPVTLSLHVAFDARADVVDDQSVPGTLMIITEQDGAVIRKILYAFDAQNAEIDEQAFEPFTDWPKALPGPPAVGKWVHYDLSLKLESATRTTLTILVDGTKVIDGPLGQVWSQGQYEVDIGLAWEETSTARWGIHYDNVVVDVR